MDYFSSFVKKIFIFFLLCAPVIGTGCGLELLIAPVVTGVIKWVEGEAHQYYPYSSHIVYRASKRALENMELEIAKDEAKKDGEYYIVAGENDRFKIKVIPHEENISRLSVRINFMGDKDYAETFYAEVDKEIPNILINENGEPAEKHPRWMFWKN